MRHRGLMSDRGIFGGCRETGALLHGIEVVMSEDECTRIALLELAKQCEHCTFLAHGARVIRFAVGIKAALIAYSDGVGVVSLAVGTYAIYVASLVNLPVARDVVVISNVAVSAVVDVVVATCLDAVLTVGARGGAVDDDKCNRSHVCVVLCVLRIDAAGDSECRPQGGYCRREDVVGNLNQSALHN